MTDTGLCLVTHRRDPDRARRAAPGLRVCPGCRSQAWDDVATLGTAHDDLAQALIARGAGGVKVAHHDSEETGIRLDHRVMATREHIRTFAVAWVRIGLDEGPWRYPPPDTLPGMTDWLCTRMDWFTAQVWADEFVVNAHECASEARRHLQPTGTRVVTLTDAPCPQPVEDGLCGGELMAAIRPLDDLLPSSIWCADCGYEAPATEWVTLGRRIRVRYDQASAQRLRHAVLSDVDSA